MGKLSPYTVWVSTNFVTTRLTEPYYAYIGDDKSDKINKLIMVN